MHKYFLGIESKCTTSRESTHKRTSREKRKIQESCRGDETFGERTQGASESIKGTI